MNYAETLAYLMAQLPMFSKVGAKAFKKDLTNTIALCEALGNPQYKFKAIHIAGTNGKGSVSHQLAAILQTAGYKTGLYTSPHLKDFRERIKVNGKPCGQQFVVNFVQKIKPLMEALQPSFFEVTVAMAFEYFAQQKVDIAVIEVGLGGRLDSTNIIHPILSVITNIGLDHVQMLGNTLPQIATEKAGIIKPQTPVVIGEYTASTKTVFAKTAKANKAPIVYAQQNFEVQKATSSIHYLQLNIGSKSKTSMFKIKVDLPGIYQQKNVTTVLQCCEVLNTIGVTIFKKHIITALANVKGLTGFYGRWQCLQTKPTVIADVAHNTDGIKVLLQQLTCCTYKKLHIVLGMVKDKDITAVLKLLPKTAQYYFTNAAIERAMPANDLQQFANTLKLQGSTYKNVNMAIKQASKNADINKDLIVVCGSVFLVAEIKNLM